MFTTANNATYICYVCIYIYIYMFGRAAECAVPPKGGFRRGGSGRKATFQWLASDSWITFGSDFFTRSPFGGRRVVVGKSDRYQRRHQRHRRMPSEMRVVAATRYSRHLDSWQVLLPAPTRILAIGFTSIVAVITVPQRGIRKGGIRKEELPLSDPNVTCWVNCWLDPPFRVPLWGTATSSIASFRCRW